MIDGWDGRCHDSMVEIWSVDGGFTLVPVVFLKISAT
jgi:hypothetical protein